MLRHVSSEDDEPAEEEVEEADRVHGQLFPVLRYHFFDKVYATVGGPRERETNVNDSDHERHVASNKHVEYGDKSEWEEAIAEEANALEEADRAAEELSVQGDHGATEPHDDEDDLEEESLVICLRAGRKYSMDGRYQSE